MMDSDSLILALNVGACLLLATLAAWAVLDERIHEGVIVRAGLILVALGFAGIAIALLHGSGVTLQRAMGLLHAGIIVVLLGREWRAHRRHKPMRRRSDWLDLEDAQQMTAPSRSRRWGQW
jgi:hypothetical protein